MGDERPDARPVETTGAPKGRDDPGIRGLLLGGARGTGGAGAGQRALSELRLPRRIDQCQGAPAAVFSRLDPFDEKVKKTQLEISPLASTFVVGHSIDGLTIRPTFFAPCTDVGAGVGAGVGGRRGVGVGEAEEGRGQRAPTSGRARSTRTNVDGRAGNRRGHTPAADREHSALPSGVQPDPHRLVRHARDHVVATKSPPPSPVRESVKGYDVPRTDRSPVAAAGVGVTVMVAVSAASACGSPPRSDTATPSDRPASHSESPTPSHACATAAPSVPTTTRRYRSVPSTGPAKLPHDTCSARIGSNAPTGRHSVPGRWPGR